MGRDGAVWAADGNARNSSAERCIICESVSKWIKEGEEEERKRHGRFDFPRTQPTTHGRFFPASNLTPKTAVTGHAD